MTIAAYKGFDKALRCRGYQFEVGKAYTHEGEVKACASGFHVCTNPMDVFSYYPPGTSRYARVVVYGDTAAHGRDSKIAAACLRVEEEISLHSLVLDAVAKILEGDSKESVATNTGNQSAATNTGYQSAATSTGYQSAATSTGNQSAATNTGNYSAATNTGSQSAATNTGNYSAATNTGYQSAATNTGNYSAATNTGNYSAATNTGDYSAATNTGYQSAAEVSGTFAVAASLGLEGRARASVESAIVLCYRNEEGTLIHIRASKVGDNGIKPDTWYSLDENGGFVEE